MMSKLNLTAEEVSRVRSWYAKNFDKYPRMFSGLSSDLTQYEEGIIHIEISNSQRFILSTYNTAVFFARKYRDFIPELSEAIGFVVTFKERNNIPGFVLRADQPEEEIRKLIDEYNKPEEPKILSLYSGVFTKEMESIKQDLSRPKEQDIEEDTTEIDTFIDNRVFPGAWIKVLFSYIIIRNDCIKEKYAGNLIGFANKYDMFLNNDLSFASYMATEYLDNMMDKLESELGLKRYEDYVIGRELSCHGIGGRINPEDQCVYVDEADWVEVVYKRDYGTFARWVKE